MNNSFDTIEMRKYKAAHSSERNFTGTPDIGFGTIAAIVSVLALCLWIVS